MLLLYHGSGSTEVQLVRQHNPTIWNLLKRNILRYLQLHGDEDATKILGETPFELWDGTNGFGDEFELLYLKTRVEEYLKFDAEATKKESGRNPYRAIARAMSELNNAIRFVVVDIAQDDAEAVSTPRLEITSATVERALNDFETLASSKGGVVSGVDRIHTALHAYLETVCDDAGIQRNDDADITALFQLIRQQHPKLQKHPPGVEAQRMLRALAQIVDALNPVRNRKSMAHPNEELLEEPEAMLAANSVKGLLHYLNTKLR
jgi:hypothetical protein